MIFRAVRFQLTHLSCDDCEYMYIFLLTSSYGKNKSLGTVKG